MLEHREAALDVPRDELMMHFIVTAIGAVLRHSSGVKRPSTYCAMRLMMHLIVTATGAALRYPNSMKRP